MKQCPKCDGEGWLWWFELDEYHGPANETGQDDQRYMCDRCENNMDKKYILLLDDKKEKILSANNMEEAIQEALGIQEEDFQAVLSGEQDYDWFNNYVLCDKPGELISMYERYNGGDYVINSAIIYEVTDALNLHDNIVEMQARITDLARTERLSEKEKAERAEYERLKKKFG